MLAPAMAVVALTVLAMLIVVLGFRPAPDPRLPWPAEGGAAGVALIAHLQAGR